MNFSSQESEQLNLAKRAQLFSLLNGGGLPQKRTLCQRGQLAQSSNGVMVKRAEEGWEERKPTALQQLSLLLLQELAVNIVARIRLIVGALS